MRFDHLDTNKLKVFPVADRQSYIDIETQAVDPTAPPPQAGKLKERIQSLADRIVAARECGASVMLAYGAHLVKNGAGLIVRQLIEGGWLTHLATQGAGIIHDWEFAFLGRSSESVRDNAPVGQFGSWDETGRWINLAAIAGVAKGLGFGESMGKLICNDGLNFPRLDDLAQKVANEPEHPLAAARADLLATLKRFDLGQGHHSVVHPYKHFSITAAAYEQEIPLTVHPGIGYDIIVNHPMFHGAAIGRGSEIDTRIFAAGVGNLDGGVYLSLGSSVMSPQIFEKAFSAANNVRLVNGLKFIRDHHMVVVDLQDSGGWDWNAGEPPPNHPAYYLRFCKTFHRMGGTLEYFQADNIVVLANLLAALKKDDHSSASV